MTGMVLSAGPTGWRGAVDRAGIAYFSIPKHDCFCGSGIAGAIALLMAFGFDPKNISQIIEDGLKCADICEAEAFFENLPLSGMREPARVLSAADRYPFARAVFLHQHPRTFFEQNRGGSFEKRFTRPCGGVGPVRHLPRLRIQRPKLQRGP